MDSADPSLVYVWTAMTLVGLGLLLTVARWYRQWRRRAHEQMSEAEAKQECAYLLSERIRVAMYAADIDKRIVDNWERWPDEYRPALWHIVRQAQLLEEVQLQEAYDKGVVPRRVFTRVPEIAPPPDPPLDSVEPPPDRSGDKVVPLHLHSPARPGERWINGQLVRTA